MWRSIETAVLIGTPIAVCGIAAGWFGWLVVRVWRGAMSRLQATLNYLLVLLLPILIPGMVLLTAMAANSGSGPERSSWNGDAGLAFFVFVLPLSVQVEKWMAGLNVVFWLTMIVIGVVRSTRSNA